MSYEIVSLGKNEPTPAFEVVSNPKEQDRSMGENALRDVGRSGKVVSSTVLGAPGATQNLIEWLVSLPSGITPDQAREKMKELGIDVPGHFPTTQELESSVEKKIPSLKPETEGEQKYENTLETFTSLLMPGAPRSLINSVTRAGIGAGGGEAAASLMKEFGIGEAAQNIARMVFALGSQLPGLRRASIAENRTRIAGKKAGLNEKELTPLLQPEKMARRIGKLTSETEKNREVLKSVKKKSDAFLDNISERGKKVIIPEENMSGLIEKTESLRNEMAMAAGEEPNRVGVIKYLDGVLDDFKKGSLTAQHLINTFRDANRMFKETMPSQKNRLQSMNKAISQAVYKTDKELGRDFRLGNRLHSARMEFIDNVGWQNLEKSWTKGTPAQEALASIVGGAIGQMSGAPGTGALVGAGTMFAINKTANWLLTSPNAGGLKKLTLKALKEDNPKMALTAYNAIKKKVKEDFPEEFSELNLP